MEYNHKEIESKWQEYWEENKSFETNKKRKNFYILDMFPYPSGDGLHVGHPRGYVGSDVISHYMRMNGYNVLHPMGWDAFGLPAENYAIKTGVNPKITTAKNIERFKQQMDLIGLSYDWSREVNTTDPEYYKWTQWIFLKLFNKGLAHIEELPINWCPSCKTGLANEEVIAGKCERCGAEVTKRNIAQWVLKITDYADKLLNGLEKLDWPEQIKEMQRNWIGKSTGADIDFKAGDETVRVFTTRPDTIFGATFMVLAPEHELVSKLTTNDKKEEVEEYVEQTKNKSDIERQTKSKTGVFIGSYAINPANNKEIPIYIADYVLPHYGYGAIMAVPGHDERDYEFAEERGLEIIPVITNNRRVIMIHGSSGKRTNINSPDYIVPRRRHWHGWLEDQLISKGYEVFNPDMPTDWSPDYNEWKRIIEGFNVDENTILVGTSAGAAFILKWLSETGKRVDRVILNAPAYIIEDENIRIRSFVDFELSESLKNQINDLTIFLSNDRDYIIKSAELIAKELGGKIIRLNNRGHFCIWDNSKNVQFLELLELIDRQIVINSEFLNGLKTEEAKKEIIRWLEKNKFGKETINYKLRDWIFSRQRYWGEPIPLVFCEACKKKIESGNIKGFTKGEIENPGWIADKNLPIELPELEDFKPTDDGNPPLSKTEDWVKTTCPKCGGEARREVNTMPQWAGSCWYYIRYIDNNNNKEMASKKNIKKWLPVDFYIGGAEHAVLHLLYSRFWAMVLHDEKVLPFDEPFTKLRTIGLILAEGGEKMSKSKGNVVNPDEVIEQYGADTFRTYEMFMGPFDQAIAWDTKGIVGVRRFIEKVWNLQDKIIEKDFEEVVVKLHQTIKKVTEDIKEQKFNTAVASMMEFANLATEKGITKESLSVFAKILYPFAPHMCSELTEDLTWPKHKVFKQEKTDLIIQVNGKLRATINIERGLSEDKVKELAEKQVSGYLEKGAKKVIFVQDKLINFVV